MWRDHRRVLLAILAVAMLAVAGPLGAPGTQPAVTGGAKPEAGTKPEGVANIILRFHNGSVVQPVVLLEAIEMETKLGKLSVPLSEVHRVDFGFRVAEDTAKKIEQALRDLESANHKAREAATKQLAALGRLAYPALLEHPSKDLEATRRVESILQTIRSRVPADHLQFRKTDVIRTGDSVIAGHIIPSTVRVHSEIFGDVKIPIHMLRDLHATSELIVLVDAAKYGRNTHWMATDFEAVAGTRLEVMPSGEIELDPLRRLGQNHTHRVTPSGIPTPVSGEPPPFNLPGLLVGRIGNDPPFVIGPRYSAPVDREGRLYLRIVTLEHANNIQAQGSFKVTISAKRQ